MRKITFWLTLVLIFTIPWEDSLTIGSAGSSLTKILGLGVAGFWFLTILIEGRFRKPHLFHVFVLLFFLWNIISYTWSIDTSVTMGRINTYAQIFILMLIIWEMLQEPSDLVAGLQAYVLGAFVPIISSLNNYVHGTVAVNYEVRFSATGVNAVDLTIFLLLGLPLAWHLIKQADKKKNRLLKTINIVFLPLAVFTVLLTGSRTSLFAIIPAAIFILWPKRVDVFQLALMALFLVFSIAVLTAILPSGVTTRLASATTSITSADIGGRVDLWEETLTAFAGHPIVGSGSGTLNTIIGGLAHETYLSVLAETGLIGFALFACILAIVLNQAIRLPKGYSGLWLSSFFVWCIGVLSLSFEFRKVTWLFLSFVIIEGSSLHKQMQSEDAKMRFSEAEESQPLGQTM